MAQKPNLRPNALTVIRQANGKVLWCERLGFPGSWQFPQGGIDPGETPETAALREAEEETGLLQSALQIAGTVGPFDYLYPPEIKARKSHDGQRQWWCLLDYTGSADAVDLAQHTPEFQAYRWVSLSKIDATALPSFKQAVYREGLAALAEIV